MNFDKSKLKKLKKLYNDSPGDTFVFEGKEVFKGYAKYLIEYLEKNFK